jgi:hypothetical protein
MAATLYNLPQSIFSSIFSQLRDDDYASLISLRSTCRRFPKLSEEVVFCEVTLTGLSDTEQVLFKRILSRNDTVGVAIHRIRLKPPGKNSNAAGIISQGLEECWDSLAILEEVMLVPLRRDN